MALTKCKECGSKISKKAKTCPSCGAPNKTGTSIGSLLTIIILGFFIFVIFSSISTTPKEEAKPKTAEEIRKEEIESHFSGWDGSHKGLSSLVKKSMNDPDSFDHTETVYWDKGDHLIVKMTFRGKNAFGGVVPSTVTAKVDLVGNVMEVISQEP